MLLTIDLGNTQTVLGWFDGGQLAGHRRISTIRSRTADEYRLLLSGLLELDGLKSGVVSGVALSSVVPQATAALREVAAGITEGRIVVVEPGVKTGLAILIDNPHEVGADRVVNAVAAAAKYGTPCVIVDFGTSTNFDVVDADGAYIGGVIAPGLEVSTDALVGRTAALRRVEFVPPRSPIGKGTVEAIQSGALYGHAGLVDGVMNRVLAELDGDVQRVATGGLASTIVPHCRTVELVDEFLTLDGLRIIYERNQEER